MKKITTLISRGDFIDLYFKIKQKGVKEIRSHLHISSEERIKSKWKEDSSNSDFWIIPAVRNRWNEMCTGSKDLEYEDYIVTNYLGGRTGLRMLSVGCGTGNRERKFARYPNFEYIRGIDLVPNLVKEARDKANELELNNVDYSCCNFEEEEFTPEFYDVVLFNSSLHHFNHVNRLITNKIIPMMKKGGLLIVFEYVGPNRLQWTNEQIDAANQLLKDLPGHYKKRFNSNLLKRRVYRPGLLRMKLVDPSEAIDSESITSSIHSNFKTIEEKQVGWDITHILFKDIAHNFLDDGEETKKLIEKIFSFEDEYLAGKENSDAVFGIYQKVNTPVIEEAILKTVEAFA